ncbi:isoamyl acetate-hydrolyzing esterase [Coemansia sp. RSA 2610]|nr:isoamyl acetate-hydrolyzing esterase [Coemansia sp. RSA 2610]
MTLSRPVVRILLVTSAVALFVTSYMFVATWTAGGPPGSSHDYMEYTYPSYDVMLAFGDSITQLGDDPATSGYLTHLTRYFERQMDVLNRGFAGFNTQQARDVVHRVFPTTQRKAVGGGPLASWARWLGGSASATDTAPIASSTTRSIWPSRNRNFPGDARKLQLCIIFFGTNDAQDEGEYGHNPISSYAENLRYFVSLLRDPQSEHYSPDTRVLLITPPATGERMIQAKKRIGDAPMILNSAAKAYAETAKQVAAEFDLPCVDLYTEIEARVHAPKERSVETDEANGNSTATTNAADASQPAAISDQYDGYDEFLIDGVHLNSAGNQLLYNLIVAKIKQTWPELKPSAPIRATPPR